MKHKKALLAGALIAPTLALTGGLAYASTADTSPPAHQTTPTVSQTYHGHDCRVPGGYRCDWRGHYGQQHNVQQGSHRQPARHPGSYRSRHGYQHRSGHPYQHRQGGSHRQAGRSYQGGWGYQGTWQHGSGCRGGDCGCRGW